MSRQGPRLSPIPPDDSRIDGVVIVPRPVHRDPRGLLVETFRADDPGVQSERFVMSYTSVTVPGEYRDRDRWHLHRVQTDRFVVPLGEMILALYDGRENSPTNDRLEVIRMSGPPVGAAGATDRTTSLSHLLTIPPGVLHCIANLSSEPFVLQNFPTEYYNAEDEGRIPFAQRPIAELGGPFSWDQVARSGQP